MDFNEKTYEGFDAMGSMVMALFEDCGLRQIISDAVKDTE